MSTRFLPLLFLGLLSLPAKAAQQCLVIGDSLTKEYEVEFPALFPLNPASWSARNWVEILHQRRNDWFDLGDFSGYFDPRLTGHEHNWAFPGATTTEIRSQLSSFQNFWWRIELEGQLEGAVERVVIFAGGNDVDNYYGQIYNGTSPTGYINATRNNLQWIVDYVRGVKSSLPIVLVSVPHLGCAPDVQRQYPTDPVKTARVTAALDSLNAQLATFAQTRGIGFVPGVYAFTKAMIQDPFRIGGIEFYKQADPDSRSRYVFSGDGFHPATGAHGKIAQLVIDAFRSKYPATQITPLLDKEIISSILGMNPDIPFQEWIATQGLPTAQRGLFDDPDGDGLANSMEFILEGESPSDPNPDVLHPVVETNGPEKLFTLTYHLRLIANEWAPSKVQQSANLMDWTDVNATGITLHPDGSQTVHIPMTTGRSFLRLKASR